MGLAQFIKSVYLSRPGAFGQRRMVAAATYPTAGSPHALFTIAGGNILLTALYGEVTTQITGACTGQVLFTPAAGAAINWDDGLLAYASGSATGGEIVLIPMDVAFPATEALAQPCPAWPYNYICPPGVIGFTVTIANMVGALEWYLYFIPLDPEVTVV